jgi:Amt family ammonium transporter
MKLSARISRVAAGAGAIALAAAPAWAQDAAAAPRAPDKGDTAWMLISAALVLMMSVPGLALFYGGLVRAKNMLSVLMQVLTIVAVAALVWVGWGYSLAFTGGSPFIGGLSKAFLKGVDATTLAATFSNGVYIPEYAYVVFQMTFACITPALIVGAFAERIRFWPLIAFVVLWLTIVYFPIAHMVWYWAGPDFLPNQPGITACSTAGALSILRAGPWFTSMQALLGSSAASSSASASATMSSRFRPIPSP